MGKNKKLILWITLIPIAMFGFGFALVPIYDVFCDVTGINGKVKNEVAADSYSIDQNRMVTVEFITSKNAKMPWEFHPINKAGKAINSIKVHLGESAKVEFIAKNLSDHTMTGQAVPSVAPSIASKYLRKTQCFCFDQQTLKAGEEIEMPVVLYIDKELPKYVKRITLSYTMFEALSGAKIKVDKSKLGRISA